MKSILELPADYLSEMIVLADLQKRWLLECLATKESCIMVTLR